jgi:hypothetical protein
MFAYMNWHNKQIDRQILQAPAFSVGHFTALKGGKSTGLEGFYSFAVDGITYSGGTTDGRFRNIGKRIYDRSFPVIYNTKNPQVNQILVFSTDFSEFGLAFPDSLKWVDDFK